MSTHFYLTTIGSIGVVPSGYLTICYFNSQTELVTWSFFDKVNINIVIGVVHDLLEAFPALRTTGYRKWLDTLEVLASTDAA